MKEEKSKSLLETLQEIPFIKWGVDWTKRTSFPGAGTIPIYDILTFIRNEIAALAQGAGLVNVGAYFSIFSVGFMKYAIHGIPEILAYFVARLGGGIISVAVIRHDFKSDSFRTIMFDCVDLIIIAVALVFVSALLEVYVTPLVF